MDEPEKEPDLAICAVSGEEHPRSKMLHYGDVLVSPEHKEAFLQRLESGESPTKNRGMLDEPVTGEIGLIFVQSARILQTQWLSFILFAVIFWAPYDLIDAFADWLYVDYGYEEDVGKPLNPIQGHLFSLFLSFTLGILAQAGFILICHRAWEGEEVQFFHLLLDALKNWSRLFRAQLLVTLSVFLEDFLVIPGFYFLVKLSVAETAAIVEKRRPGSAMRRSYHLTEGSAGISAFFSIVVSIILGALPLLGLNLVWPYLGIDSWIVSALLTWVLSLPNVYLAVLFYVLFRHLIARRRNLEEEEKAKETASAAIETAGSSPTVSSEPNS